MKDKDFYLNINIIIGGENGDTNFTTIEKKFIFDLEEAAKLALSQLIEKQGFSLPGCAFKYVIPNGFVFIAYDFWID
jgi:hypothetical protein